MRTLDEHRDDDDHALEVLVGVAVLLLVGAIAVDPVGLLVADVAIPIPYEALAVGMHTAGFALLGAVAAIVTRRRGWRHALVAAVAYGALVELVQAVIPYRSFAWLDLVANVGGVLVGALVVATIAAVRVSGRGGDTS